MNELWLAVSVFAATFPGTGMSRPAQPIRAEVIINRTAAPWESQQTR